MFSLVSTDVFAVVADPTRRRILHALIDRERSVGDLVGSLGLSQPTVSKHLKVLRDNGFVASRTAAQQRIYRLDQPPFAELETWLGPFLQKWNTHLDALERHLDIQDAIDTSTALDQPERNDE
jgi:DNA-binding transcriptional ArsR family regulator